MVCCKCQYNNHLLHVCKLTHFYKTKGIENIAILMSFLDMFIFVTLHGKTYLNAYPLNAL